jgi:hypothetical protein
MTAKFLYAFLVSPVQPAITLHYPQIPTWHTLHTVWLFFFVHLSPLSSKLHVPPISHPFILPPWIMQLLITQLCAPSSYTFTIRYTLLPLITRIQSTFPSMYDEYARSLYGIQYMTLFEHDTMKNTSRGFIIRSTTSSHQHFLQYQYCYLTWGISIFWNRNSHSVYVRY